ncbi:excalibur calcium-binding domain-containing protein [Modestobacter sp. DSM 44400]|uniref:excalibur calcium-binding domain-containing protein n=1 Tax=Modestobacter sp. DSM 44400 TaxID=1550230 RepID=UPI000B882104|nr:excalibur calcium-binding domain-containing protein [Modestobacter sp. DSM 44400]
MPAGPSAYHANCDEIRAAGAAPINRGDPGCRAPLDRDDDGVACEDGESAPTPVGTNTALPTAGQPAYTGVTPLPAAGAALLALGSGLLVSGRRRV